MFFDQNRICIIRSEVIFNGNGFIFREESIWGEKSPVRWDGDGRKKIYNYFEFCNFYFVFFLLEEKLRGAERLCGATNMDVKRLYWYKCAKLVQVRHRLE